MIPSSAEVAENLRKHAEGMANEIARRCMADDNLSIITEQHATIKRHALGVLLDWYLGDFLPGAPK